MGLKCTVREYALRWQTIIFLTGLAIDPVVTFVLCYKSAWPTFDHLPGLVLSHQFATRVAHPMVDSEELSLCCGSVGYRERAFVVIERARDLVIMLFLLRLIQLHESFRKAELESLALLHKITLEIIQYDISSPFAIVDLPSGACATALISRSVLCKSIHELWGSGTTLLALHEDVKRRRASEPESWSKHRDSSFRFNVDCYQGSRSLLEQREIINSFAYLDLQGPIAMKAPDEEFTVFENYLEQYEKIPSALYLGRLIASSDRDAILRFDLKKRRYISTTTMDAELALVSSNLALSAPGRVVYDPFCGTGSFLVAAAYHGAQVLGSDMDGRSIRGKPERNFRSNFEQYGIMNGLLGTFVADLTNSPVRLGGGEERRVHSTGRWLDAIVCDPPYGVREALKVLGSRRVLTVDEALERRRKDAALYVARFYTQSDDDGSDWLTTGGSLRCVQSTERTRTCRRRSRIASRRCSVTSLCLRRMRSLMAAGCVCGCRWLMMMMRRAARGTSLLYLRIRGCGCCLAACRTLGSVSGAASVLVLWIWIPMIWARADL